MLHVGFSWKCLFAWYFYVLVSGNMFIRFSDFMHESRGL